MTLAFVALVFYVREIIPNSKIRFIVILSVISDRLAQQGSCNGGFPSFVLTEEQNLL